MKKKNLVYAFFGVCVSLSATAQNSGVAIVEVTTDPDLGNDTVTFTGTPDELRARLDAFEAAGATGFVFGTSGVDVERELRACAEVAGL